jgi:selenocysteine lyase/cysteine desulfurase
VLIARKRLFSNPVPSQPGGGTVSCVTPDKHWYTRDIERREEAGTPDIEVLLPKARCVHLEAKGTKATKPSPAQLEWHARAARLGHEVVIVRTVQEAIDAVARAMRGEAA